MKIQRVLTYEVSKSTIQNFFDEDWWDDTPKIGEPEFEALEETLVADDDYCDEQWIYLGDSKKAIEEIWKKQLAKHSPKVTRLKEQLEYFQKELEYNQKQIKELQEAIAGAE